MKDTIRTALATLETANTVANRLAQAPVSDDTRNCAVQDDNAEFLLAVNAADEALGSAAREIESLAQLIALTEARGRIRQARQAYYRNVESNRKDAAALTAEALAFDTPRLAVLAVRNAEEVACRLALVPVSDLTRDCAIQADNNQFLPAINAAETAIATALLFTGAHADFQAARQRVQRARAAYYRNVESNRQEAATLATEALSHMKL